MWRLLIKRRQLSLWCSRRRVYPVELQRLIYAGHDLEDERTFDDYCIFEGFTLHVVLRRRAPSDGRVQVKVQNSSGAYIAYLDLLETDTIAMVKAQIQGINGMTVDEQYFVDYADPSGGESHPLDDELTLSGLSNSCSKARTFTFEMK